MNTATHEMDIDLVQCVQKYLNKIKKSHPEYSTISKLLEEYKSASRLSRGPDKSRSEHWSRKARIYYNQLRKKEVDLYVED